MPEMPTTRERVLPRDFPGSMQYYYLGDRYLNSVGSKDVSGTQRTVSEGHPVSLLGKTDEDLGGDFETFKSEVVYVSHPHVVNTTNVGPPRWGEYWQYEGCIVPPRTAPMSRDNVPLRSRAQLDALGATAISRCSPVNSHAELLTSLSESLKDGLPSVPGIQQWQAKTAAAKGAGSEYLNAQFGWVPLVDDIKNVIGSVRNSAKLLRQFEKDAGRTVRRQYKFPLETHTERIHEYEGVGAGSQATLSAYVLMPPHFVGGNEFGRSYTIRETKVKTWFSGAFTYHMPASSSQVGKFMGAIQEFDLLFGGVPTPDVVWNLTPWSWATDWFANTGDVLTNLSNAMLYGQILRYGYLMEQTTIIDRNTLELPYCNLGTRFESVVKTTVKRRIRANPFGFGITFDGLNAYQLSILAALGITRR